MKFNKECISQSNHQLWKPKKDLYRKKTFWNWKIVYNKVWYIKHRTCQQSSHLYRFFISLRVSRDLSLFFLSRDGRTFLYSYCHIQHVSLWRFHNIYHWIKKKGLSTYHCFDWSKMMTSRIRLVHYKYFHEFDVLKYNISWHF